jgi:hypothetical protein
MPKGTKVAKAERALRASARAKGLTGERANRYIFSTLNKIGLKRGSKTTARGRSPAKRSR